MGDWFGGSTGGVNDWSGAGIGAGSGGMSSGYSNLGGGGYTGSIGTDNSFMTGLEQAGYQEPSWGDRFSDSANNYFGQEGAGLMQGMLAGGRGQQQSAMLPQSDPTSNIGTIAAMKNISRQEPDPFNEYKNKYVQGLLGAWGGF